MQSMMELPDEVLLRMARWSKIESLGKLAQSCTKWYSITQDEEEWKRRIFEELTKQPKLRPGQSFKEYYKNIYDSRTYSNYKSYLTKPIENLENLTEENRHSYVTSPTKYSLEAYLITACREGSEIWAENLIKLGANPNVDIDMSNPLTEATMHGHLLIIDLLIDHGANIDACCGISGNTIFHEALNSPFPQECLNKLLNTSNYKNITVLPELHKAIILNDLMLIKQLLDNQIDLDEIDSRELSPLGWAIILGRTECVKMLIEKGASLEEVSPAEYAGGLGAATALRLAIERKQVSSLKLILENGGNLNDTWLQCTSVSKRGHLKNEYTTPLEVAVEKNFPEGLSLLLQYDVTDEFDKALSNAALCGYLECMKILIQYGNESSNKNNTQINQYKKSSIDIDEILISTARHGHFDCLQYLLNIDVGSNSNLPKRPSQSGKNLALQAAAEHIAHLKRETNQYHLSTLNDWHYSYEDCPDIHSKARFEFEQKKYDPSKIKYILSYSALSNFEWLIKYGAEINFINNENQSALSILISGIGKENNIIDINTNKVIMRAIDILFHYNVNSHIVIDKYDYNLKKKVGFSPLQYALKLENLSLIKLLVEKGYVNINDRDSEGNTPLEVASQKGNTDIIQYLNEKLSEMTLSNKPPF